MIAFLMSALGVSRLPTIALLAGGALAVLGFVEYRVYHAGVRTGDARVAASEAAHRITTDSLKRLMVSTENQTTQINKYLDLSDTITAAGQKRDQKLKERAVKSEALVAQLTASAASGEHPDKLCLSSKAAKSAWFVLQ